MPSLPGLQQSLGTRRGRHIDAIGFLQTLAPWLTALHCGPSPFPLLVNSLRREERPQTDTLRLPATERSFLSSSLPLFVTHSRLSVSALRSAALPTRSSSVAVAHLDSLTYCLFPFGLQIRPRLAHAHSTILTNCRSLARLSLARAWLRPYVTDGPPLWGPPAACHRTRALALQPVCFLSCIS